MPRADATLPLRDVADFVDRSVKPLIGSILLLVVDRTDEVAQDAAEACVRCAAAFITLAEKYIGPHA
jgi:hypothetical protein